MPSLDDVVRHLDELLQTSETPDYGGALNGLQLENSGRVTRVAAAVDFSLRTVEGAVAEGADLLVVHHGMFWAGAQPLRGVPYRRLRLLLERDVAVYASHLPLDRHPALGNNALLARELGLDPAGEFARYKTIAVGVRGEADVATADLVARARTLAEREGGGVRATRFDDGRRTRRWAICTGAGASSDTVREALELGVDTLVVGEGPHHTAVEAGDLDLVIVYAGHYATETLGVRALARHLSTTFGVPWAFIAAPTGL
ncbi:MAG: Nif3-like dinuclear metal center hexameric protein [Gemmatimonadaceae bacterium]